MKGGDHAASLEAKGFMSMIDGTRKIENALGSGNKCIMPGEEEVMRKLKKSIVASKEIAAGTVLSSEMVTLKSPGTGLGGNMLNKILGRVLTKKRNEDDLILLSHLR